jgi:hypothetical protein
MHWHETNVNPMLALRNIICSDRWQKPGRRLKLACDIKPESVKKNCADLAGYRFKSQRP